MSRKPPASWRRGGSTVADASCDRKITAPWRFLRRAEALADGLPDDAGALAFLLAPEQIKDPASFIRSIEFLASRANSRWLRFIVLEDRASPLLADLAAAHLKVTSQTFWLPPDRMARRQEANDGFAALSPNPRASRQPHGRRRGLRQQGLCAHRGLAARADAAAGGGESARCSRSSSNTISGAPCSRRGRRRRPCPFWPARATWPARTA